MLENGSIPFPRRLDILFPFLSNTNPLEITFLNATEPRTIVLIDVSVEDVEIFSEDIPGWLVTNEGKFTVALDITITDELQIKE